MALEQYFRKRSSSSIQKMFLKLLALVLPATATVERTFSDMKMVKTRLRSRLEKDTLYSLRIYIEGKNTLDYEKLECIIGHWKLKKTLQFCN